MKNVANIDVTDLLGYSSIWWDDSNSKIRNIIINKFKGLIKNGNK